MPILNQVTLSDVQSVELADRHFQIAHRHKISLIDACIPTTQMREAWTDRLSGKLFTSGRGYDGPGVGWATTSTPSAHMGSCGDGRASGQAEMWANTDVWVNWFYSQVLVTPTDYFLFLIDELDEYPQTEEWVYLDQ